MIGCREVEVQEGYEFSVIFGKVCGVTLGGYESAILSKVFGSASREFVGGGDTGK